MRAQALAGQHPGAAPMCGGSAGAIKPPPLGHSPAGHLRRVARGRGRVAVGVLLRVLRVLRVLVLMLMLMLLLGVARAALPTTRVAPAAVAAVPHLAVGARLVHAAVLRRWRVKHVVRQRRRRVLQLRPVHRLLLLLHAVELLAVQRALLAVQLHAVPVLHTGGAKHGSGAQAAGRHERRRRGRGAAPVHGAAAAKLLLLLAKGGGHGAKLHGAKGAEGGRRRRALKELHRLLRVWGG